jgi:hypothetical protein
MRQRRRQRNGWRGLKPADFNLTFVPILLPLADGISHASSDKTPQQVESSIVTEDQPTPSHKRRQGRHSQDLRNRRQGAKPNALQNRYRNRQ